MITGNDTNIGADMTSMKEMLSRLVELFSEASGALSTIGQQLAGTAGSDTGVAAATNSVPSDPPPIPKLPDTFSGFVSDAFTGEGLFEKPEQEKEEGGDDTENAEKVKALSKDASKTQVDSDEEQTKSDKKLWASKLANAIAGSKKLAKVRKAYAIGAAVVNAAIGITETFKKHGFPKAIPFAAALAVAAAKQISVIKGQAHAGLDKVPSSGTYLLEKGERVVGKRLNQDLSSFLGVAGGSGSFGGFGPNNSVANLDRSTNSNSTFNPTINLTVGGGASEDAVFANRGAVETMIREIYADYAQEAPFGV